MGSPLTPKGVRGIVSLPPGMERSPVSHLAFFIPLHGVEGGKVSGLLTDWQRQTSRFSIDPLLAGVGEGLQFFLWCFAGAERLVANIFSLFLCCPFPGALARESRLLLEHY